MVDLRDEGMLPADFNPYRHSPPSEGKPLSRFLFSPFVLQCLSDPHMSPSLAYLAKLYNFDPLPPPMPTELSEKQKKKLAPKAPAVSAAYDNSVQEFLASASSYAKKPKATYGQKFVDHGPKRIIPGWNDGSNAWRAALYSFAPTAIACTTETSVGGIFTQVQSSSNVAMPSAAYDGFVASPHRTAHSVKERKAAAEGLRPNGPIRRSSSSSDADRMPSTRRRTEDSLMMEKFSHSFVRSESRASLSNLSSSAPSARSPMRRERPLLPQGAEGKLLVPQVMMRVPGSVSTASSSSLPALSEDSCDSPTSSTRSIPRRRSGQSSTKPVVRSPLSVHSSTDDSDSSDGENVKKMGTIRPPVKRQNSSKRPTVESKFLPVPSLESILIVLLPSDRSWSYDNVLTYPTMEMPAGLPKSNQKLFLFSDPV